MAQAMKRTAAEWAAMGLAFVSGVVKQQIGRGNQAQMRIVDNDAQLIELRDLDKAIAAGLGESIVESANGTSWKVIAQRVNRDHGIEVMDGKAKPWTTDQKQEAVFAAIRGMRSGGSRTTTITKIVMVYPDGETYEGTNAVEFVSTYIGKAVDEGVPVDVARRIAAKTWDKAHPEAPLASLELDEAEVVDEDEEAVEA